MIALAQFFVAVLVGGGEPDLEKHLFMFNLVFDPCLILFVLWAITRIQRFRPVLFRSTGSCEDHVERFPEKASDVSLLFDVRLGRLIQRSFYFRLGDSDE
jgi:hypothetical protein